MRLEKLWAGLAAICVVGLTVIISLVSNGYMESGEFWQVMGTVIGLALILVLYIDSKGSEDDREEQEAAFEMVVATLDVGAEHKKLHKLAKTAVEDAAASADADRLRADEIEGKDPARGSDRLAKVEIAKNSQRAFWDLHDALKRYGLLLPDWKKVAYFANAEPGPKGWTSDAPVPTVDTAEAA